MPSANVEIVLGQVEALARGDYDGAAEYLHPDAEWHNTAVFPGPKVVSGAGAIRAFWEDLFDAYGASDPDSGMEVEEVAEGGDLVVVLVHGWGHGRGSGIPFDTRWAHSIEVRGSKIIRTDTYGSYEKALAASGLRS